jgi:hypothetical protein
MQYTGKSRGENEGQGFLAEVWQVSLHGDRFAGSDLEVKTVENG